MIGGLEYTDINIKQRGCTGASDRISSSLLKGSLSSQNRLSLHCKWFIDVWMNASILMQACILVKFRVELRKQESEKWMNFEALTKFHAYKNNLGISIFFSSIYFRL